MGPITRPAHLSNQLRSATVVGGSDNSADVAFHKIKSRVIYHDGRSQQRRYIKVNLPCLGRAPRWPATTYSEISSQWWDPFIDRMVLEKSLIEAGRFHIINGRATLLQMDILLGDARSNQVFNENLNSLRH